MIEDQSSALAAAELLLARCSARRRVSLAQLARRALDQAWVRLEGQVAVSCAVLEEEANALEAAILARGEDDALAAAAATALYATRAVCNPDGIWLKCVWDVLDEQLEDINDRTPAHVSLAAVRQAIPRTNPSDLHAWSQGRDCRSLVRDLRPSIPRRVRGIARAVAKLNPEVVPPLPPPGVAEARQRALQSVGVSAFAKALEPLAAALPPGEKDPRWQPSADRVLAAVAGDRISVEDYRDLSQCYEKMVGTGV